jgi:long-chain acyl-CoA synthetase
MMVVGGDDKKFIAALIVPSFVQLSAWAKEHELTFNSNNELITLPKTIAFMEQEAEKLNPNFGHWEQIKKTKLLPDEWSVETGELTPTMKPKRKVIYEKYAKEIEAIFR